ncbi:hypothetical protein LIER_19278 [Lithospermum erythrorhizon]|uniref:Trichome birefringence-like N-terminal domain-containing protein n=1 Tax=Lithospermum erythrorhizon TaxID=34254 RepID=A0AAV3QKZ7_LITER
MNNTIHYSELPNGKKNPILKNSKKVLFPFLTLALLISMSFYLSDYNNNESILNASEGSPRNSTSPRIQDAKERCNIFKGDWILDPLGQSYYTNETECVIDDRQNCMKFGRKDDEFLKWRWKPDECELPKFDAMQFLEVVRGKTLAFLGDSVGRNQMQSLVCMLASASYHPKDVSYVPNTTFRRWFYPSHNFTIEALWSPNLVKANEIDANGYSATSLMALHLDKPDEKWSGRIEHVDIVIVSAGHWFFRPLYLYEKGLLIGCVMCHDKNITKMSRYHGYKMAFRTTFETLMNKNFKGLVFLRTFSPSHFENGDWDKGGSCVRTKPFSKDEMKLDGYALEMYMTQVGEFKKAEKKGRKMGVKFRMMDTSEAMILRGDGHPNHYGHWPTENKTIADCVHWCMPGPVETWNEFLLQMLKSERG